MDSIGRLLFLKVLSRIIVILKMILSVLGIRESYMIYIDQVCIISEKEKERKICRIT